MDTRAGLREAALVVGVGAFQVFTAHAGGERPTSEPLDLLGVALLLAGPVSLPLRRRAPWLVLLVAVLSGALYFPLGYPGAAVFATAVVVVVSLRRRRTAEERLRHDEEQRRRAVEERLAVARDLHDVLAHSLSVVQVQAGVALHLLEARPEQVRDSLTAIRTASDEGMRELRAAVATLRRDGEAPLAPTSGLADLPRLLDGARAAGLQVQGPDAVPEVAPQTGLVAYRVVQEALTNAVRHAGATRCTVDVRTEGGRLLVRVQDDGTGGVAAPGNGLRGMRERVDALGGTLSAGPAPSGGFLVEAGLPA